MHSDATLHMLMQSVKLRIMKLPPPGPSSAWSLGHITPATVSQTSGDGEGGGGVIGKGEGGVKHSMQPAHLNQAHLFAQGLELKLHMPLHAGGGRDGGGGSGGDGGGGSGEGGVRHSTQPAHAPLTQAHLTAQGLVFKSHTVLQVDSGGDGGGGDGSRGSYTPPYIYSP